MKGGSLLRLILPSSEPSIYGSVKIEDILIDVENLLGGAYDDVDESKFLFIGKYHE